MLPRPTKSLQNGTGFSGKIEHTGPADKERVTSVPQKEQLASTPEPPLTKGKGTEPSVQSTGSWGERVNVGESRTSARERGIRAGAWRGKGGLHSEERQVSRKKGWASKKSLPRRSRRKARAGEWTQKLSRTICRVLVSLQVWPNLKWERRLGDKEPDYKMKE